MIAQRLRSLWVVLVQIEPAPSDKVFVSWCDRYGFDAVKRALQITGEKVQQEWLDHCTRMTSDQAERYCGGVLKNRAPSAPRHRKEIRI